MRLILLTALLVLAPLAAVPAVAAVQVVAIEADPADHVGVALELSALTFEAAEEVLVGRADDFADSLASGGLQGERPLLLTPTDALDPRVADEIGRLGTTRATILGGEVAVGTAVADALEDLGLDVSRLAGPSRIETAVAAAPAQADVALLARAAAGDDPTQGFADSLAAGGWAAAADIPVLLTPTGGLADATAAYLAAAGVETVHVLGGEAAVGGEVARALADDGIVVERVAGTTRAGTAVAVARARGFASAAAAGAVVLVDGTSPDGWAAGFAAAAHSGRADAPVVLADGAGLPPETAAWLAGSSGEAGSTGPAGFAQPAATTLVCAAPAAACEAAADLLDADPVGLAQAGAVVHHGTPLTGRAKADVAEITWEGACLPGGRALVRPGADGRYALAIDAGDDAPAEGTCTLDWSALLDDGSVLTGAVAVQVEVADVALTHPDGVVFLGRGGDGVVDVDVDALQVAGGCAGGATTTVPVADDGSFTLPAVQDGTALGDCVLTVEVPFADGGRQTSQIPLEVGCLGGMVADHDPSGAYELFDGAPDDLFEVAVDRTDRFEIAGQPASYAAFLDALAIGACATPHRPIDADDVPHRLWPVGPCPGAASYVDPQRVYATDEDANTYVIEVDGSPTTITYGPGDDFRIGPTQQVSLADFELNLAPGACIDHLTPQRGAASHRLVAEALATTPYVGNWRF